MDLALNNLTWHKTQQTKPTKPRLCLEEILYIQEYAKISLWTKNAKKMYKISDRIKINI